MALRVVELIERKRDGGKLTAEEIEALVLGYAKGEVPDYQMAAFCMAVVWRGMDTAETAALTSAMVGSGERLDLSRFGRVVDKHSTGGVGDKTTLVVGPLVAACGAPVAKMSGRGLGFSGGTLDKLESIAGYRVDLSTAEFLAQLGRIGIVVTGQTADLAPADGLLYALRDTTGTVPSIPLIASSVMSKKIAAGAHAVVLDVKVGRGAFMKDLAQARALAKAMVAIGVAHGLAVTCELTDMEQPLGRAVGNSLEISEAIAALRGEGPPDLVRLARVAGAEMLVRARRARDTRAGLAKIDRALDDGSGLAKFRELVAAQGGDPEVVDDRARLPRAPLGRAARRGLDARSQHRHEVADGRVAGGLDGRGGRRRRLRSQKAEQLLAVRVGVTRRGPRRRQRGDEALGRLHLALGDGEIRKPGGQLLGAPNLVREEERLEGESLLQGPDRDEVRLGAEHEATDADHSRGLHGAKEEQVGLLGAGAADRPHVIALLVEDGIDLRQVHELLDRDRPASLRGDRGQLGLGDRHEVAARELDAPYDVIGFDRPRRGRRSARNRSRDGAGRPGRRVIRHVRSGLRLVRRGVLGPGDALVAHAFARAPVVELETHVLRLGPGIGPHPAVHQAEADAAPPYRLSHLRPSHPRRRIPRLD